MKGRLVAKRYAKAFLNNIKEDEYQSILDDIDFLKKIFSKDRDAASIMNLFIFPKSKKKEILDSISENLKVKEKWDKLFDLLIAKQKFNTVMELFDQIERVILSFKDTIKVNLKTAYDLDEITINKLKVYISGILDKNVILNVAKDETIIGGFIAETEDEIIDGSVKNHLDKFSQYVTDLL